jgi:hypothetical protein
MWWFLLGIGCGLGLSPLFFPRLDDAIDKFNQAVRWLKAKRRS